MPTLFQWGEFRVILFVHDHPPPHVHVVDDAYAKVAIGRVAGDVRLTDVRNIAPRIIRAIVKEISVRRSTICDAWSSIHGEAS
jgi:hypothetical protein